MKVIKVINNNNLCVLDDKGKEQIVSGKGIGFGKKYGDTVDPLQIQKTYLITDSELQKKMITMLREIPSEYMVFANDMVEYIKKEYESELNESLLVALSDHIAFAIERKKKGIEFTNPLLESIKEAYPQELSLGEYCVEQLKEQFDYIVSRAVTDMPTFVGWVRGMVRKGEKGTRPNGILYLKGGDLTEELKASRRKWERVYLSEIFEEEFFETKQVVYSTEI